jgi:small subunit ribosomal protein S16
MLHHLHGGVRKGAMTQEQADAKFEAWQNDKANKVQSKRDTLADKRAAVDAERFKAETAVKEAKAAAIAAKNVVVEEVPAEEAPVSEAEVSDAPEAESNAPETTEA